MDSSLLNPEKFFKVLDSLSDDALLRFIAEWHERGETAEELKGFVDYLRSLQSPIETGFNCIDCAGTGGDRSDTFNISSASAILAAAVGVKITKNGGRSSTSRSGSVDVLEALGVNLAASQEQKLIGLANANLAFFSSPVSAKLLARVKQLCREHKRSSFLSLLAPLTSPVKLKAQLLGVGQNAWMDCLAAVFSLAAEERDLVSASLPERALLVHSSRDEFFRLDEFSMVSSSRILNILGSKKQEFEFSPMDIGLELVEAETLVGGDSQQNAAIILDILDYKERGAKLFAVCLNSAALVYLNNTHDLEAIELASKDIFLKSMREAFELCHSAIEDGSAKSNFEKFLRSQL